MRPVVVVEVLEGVDALGDFVDVDGEFVAGVEFVSPCAVASLDSSVELWGAGREGMAGVQIRYSDGLLAVQLVMNEV